jgi:hypothetical protein
MAIGPGKYDALATIVRESTSAGGVILIVIDGAHGAGFSVQATPEVTAKLPALLRMVADSIERDLRGGAE